MKPENRTAIIGTVMDKKPNMTQMSVLISETNESKQVWVPDSCVAHQYVVDGTTIVLLQDTQMNGALLSVAHVYKAFAGHTNHAELKDMSDAWIEFGTVNTQTEPQAFVEEDMPTEEETFVEEDMPTEEETFVEEDMPTDDYDDSTPSFEGAGIDLALPTQDADATAQAKKKASAVVKAAQAREARFAAAKEIKENLNTDFAKAFADGKRHEDMMGAWNFEADVVEMAQVRTDPITGEQTVHIPRNPNTGEAKVRCIVNPTLADQDNPFGVMLNRAIGEHFEHIDHPAVFKPVIECINGINDSAGKELISWDAYSINNGKRAIMNLDITGYATKTRKESASNLGNFGYVNLSANRISDALVEEHGGHRIGVTIMNAHDGKSALQSFMSVLRTYCGNLAMRGGVQNLLMAGSKSKLRHMKGNMAEFDADQFAERVTTALHDAQKNLLAMHILRHLPIEQNLFDKVLTVFSKQGLIAPPTVKIHVADLNQFAQTESGGTSLTLGDLGKDAVKMAGGHAYNAVLSGWMNPDLGYVAMGKENGSELDAKSHGTMFHAAQAMTGTLTHNPVWSDGKRTLHGKSQGIETMMKRSSKATNLLEHMAFAAVNTYAAHTGEPVDDLEAMGQWFAENPDQLQVPVSSYKANSSGNWNPKTVGLTEVQDFTETWNVKHITVEAQVK
jgi:hypothetical protein